MNARPGTIERAFELARNSQLTTVEQIRKQLKAEGYGDWQEQLSGSHIRQQLREIVWAKRRASGAPGQPDGGAAPSTAG